MTFLAALLAAVGVYLLIVAGFGWNTPRRRRAPRVRVTTRVPAATQLRQAGVGMSPARYRASIAASMLTVFVIVLALTGTAPLAVLAAVVTASAPRAFYRRRRDRVLAERVAAWPEAIRDVLTHLAVDNTLHRALVQLARSGPPALRPVWRTYARNAAVLDVPVALAQIRAELADPVSDHVIEAFEAAHERGQSVAVDVLAALADHVTRDVALREEIITGQTETRAQAVFAIVIPFLLLAFLVSTNDAFARFYARPAGWVVIAIGAAMAFGGWKLIGALGRIPVDPRLLTRRGPRT